MKLISIPSIAATFLLASASVTADPVDESRAADPNGRIEFSTVTGNLTVLGHDEPSFRLTGELGDDVEELRIEGRSSNWRIEIEPLENLNWSASNNTSELTLFVPRGTDFEATTVNGHLDVSGLTGPGVELQTVNGGIKLHEIEADSVSAQTVSGAIDAEAVTAEDNEYQAVNGHVTVRDARGSIEVSTVNGSITLTAMGVTDMESETVSGALRADMQVLPRANVQASSHSGSIELMLDIDDTPRIRADSFSGRISGDFGDGTREGHGPGSSLRVAGAANAVEVEASSFSGNILLRRAD